jgi:hypothetical protein
VRFIRRPALARRRCPFVCSSREAENVFLFDALRDSSINCGMAGC